MSRPELTPFLRYGMTIIGLAFVAFFIYGIVSSTCGGQ